MPQLFPTSSGLWSDRFLMRLVAAVVVLHLALVVYGWQRSELALPVKRKAVVVRTVQLPSPKKREVAKAHTKTTGTAASKPQPQERVKTAPKAKKKAVVAKKKAVVAKKKAVVKKVEKKEKKPFKSKKKTVEQAPAPQKSVVDAKRQEAVKQAQAKLGQLKKTKDGASKPTGSAPRVELSARTTLPAANAKPTATSYEDELTQRLRMELRLPEYGQVRLALTLSREGDVKHVEVLETQSTVNRKYVEQRVAKLRFSSFGQRFPDEDNRRFVLVLTNDL